MLPPAHHLLRKLRAEAREAQKTALETMGHRNGCALSPRDPDATPPHPTLVLHRTTTVYRIARPRTAWGNKRPLLLSRGRYIFTQEGQGGGDCCCAQLIISASSAQRRRMRQNTTAWVVGRNALRRFCGSFVLKKIHSSHQHTTSTYRVISVMIDTPHRAPLQLHVVCMQIPSNPAR